MEQTSKRCSSCKQTLPVAQFGRRAKERDGLQPACKACTNAANRSRRELRSDECRARDRRRYAETAEHRRACRREYRRAHADVLRPRWIAERQARKERGYNFTRNRAVKAADQAIRDAAKIRATPRWANRSLIKAIYQECRETSERTGIPHHVDHVIPLRGKTVCGLHVESNLQVIPAAENVRKRNRFIAG